MLLAERAVLAENESIGIVLLVLHRIVVSALAFRAFKSDFRSCCLGCHNKTPYKKITPRKARILILPHFIYLVNLFCAFFKSFLSF